MCLEVREGLLADMSAVYPVTLSDCLLGGSRMSRNEPLGRQDKEGQKSRMQHDAQHSRCVGTGLLTVHFSTDCNCL